MGLAESVNFPVESKSSFVINTDLTERKKHIKETVHTANLNTLTAHFRQPNEPGYNICTNIKKAKSFINLLSLSHHQLNKFQAILSRYTTIFQSICVMIRVQIDFICCSDNLYAMALSPGTIL
jgi:hypothetical protein